jgi:putative hemolysin
LPVYSTLETFRQTRAPLLLIANELGDFVGIVTPKDLLEALAGEVPSIEEPAEEARIVRRDDGSYLLDGTIPFRELGELLGTTNEPPAPVQTLGGLVMALLQRVPEAGESADWAGYRLEVVDMDGYRVDKVLVWRIDD